MFNDCPAFIYGALSVLVVWAAGGPVLEFRGFALVAPHQPIKKVALMKAGAFRNTLPPIIAHDYI